MDVPSKWLAYGDLAWTQRWLSDSGEYEDEVAVYVDLIEAVAAEPPRTLLHLGCGAGGHDASFKQRFTVTGVDLSVGMLEMARGANPDLEYIEGDMRAVRLNRAFDVVVIPDSIGYMVSPDDLRQSLRTAAAHLKPQGVLLVTANVQETFRDNNFAYSGEREGVHVTLLENNYVNPLRSDTYEATLVYLIRQGGDLSIRTDHHVLGLFSRAMWEEAFTEAGFVLVRESSLDGLYDSYLLGQGEYPMTVYVGSRM